MKLTKEQRLHWKKVMQREKTRAKFKTPPGDPFYTRIGRYTCSLCTKIRYYDMFSGDKDSPQYAGKKKVLTICHDCWHDRGFNKIYKEQSSLVGLPGCRWCNLQLQAKLRSRKSRKAPRQEDSAPVEEVHIEVKKSPGVRKSGRVRRRLSLSR